MRLMSVRAQWMESVFDLWNSTSIPLLNAVDNKIIPLANGTGDDLGLYYFVPYIARLCGISLGNALNCWDIGIISCGVMIATTGFFYLSTTKLEKLISLCGVAAIVPLMWFIGNVYIMPFFAFSFFPLVVVFLKRERHLCLVLYSFVMGLSIGFANSVRMYTGFGLAVAAVSAIYLYTKNIRMVVIASFFIVGGVAMYSAWFASVRQQPEDFCMSLYKDETPAKYKGQHVFWHNIYAGLGFITNELGLYYDDACVLAKIKEVKPDIVYCSAGYDDAVKEQVLDIVKHHFQFVIHVLLAKCGILLFYLLKFANIGLLCAWFYRKPWYLEIPYLLALGFYALPGLLTIPVVFFLGGFMTVATFYGIHSIIWALQHGLLQDIRNFLRRLFYK